MSGTDPTIKLEGRALELGLRLIREHDEWVDEQERLQATLATQQEAHAARHMAIWAELCGVLGIGVMDAWSMDPSYVEEHGLLFLKQNLQALGERAMAERATTGQASH